MWKGTQLLAHPTDDELAVGLPVYGGFLIFLVKMVFNYSIILLGLLSAFISNIFMKKQESIFSYPPTGCGIANVTFQEVQDGPLKRHISQPIAARAESLAEAILDACGGSLPPSWHEIDVACGGGGFRGQYTGGVLSVLKALERRGALRIHRYSGASIGAAAATCFAAEGDFENYFRAPYGWQALYTGHFWRGYPTFRAMMEAVLPHNAHRLASGRVFVSVTTLTPQPSNVMVSDFRDRKELLDSLCASGTIPLLTGNPLFSRWGGSVALDGGLTNNVPTFEDMVRPQLVINLGHIRTLTQPWHYP